MAEQDKANVTSNLTSDDSNKVQVSKKKTSSKKKKETEEVEEVAEENPVISETPVAEITTEPEIEAPPTPEAPKEEEITRVKFDKLSGPNILGKIELPVEPKKKPAIGFSSDGSRVSYTRSQVCKSSFNLSCDT